MSYFFSHYYIYTNFYRFDLDIVFYRIILRKIFHFTTASIRISVSFPLFKSYVRVQEHTRNICQIYETVLKIHIIYFNLCEIFVPHFTKKKRMNSILKIILSIILPEKQSFL